MKKLLMIEDDDQIADIIRIYFSARDFEVTWLPDGSGAAEAAAREDFSLVLLDIMLPGIDGFTVCRQIRRASTVPMVFLTARGREEDILYGYELGADDYVVKPFSLPALYAKCQAIIKRCSEGFEDSRIICGRITIDTRTLAVISAGVEVELPPKEFLILRYLMTHKGWVIDRQTMLDKVWGIDYFGSDRVVDNHIRNLRAALGEPGKQIKTVFARGYKLCEE